MKYNTLVNSFSSGELGPKLSSRVDIDQYSSGAKSIENFYIGKTGGAFRRPGLEVYDNVFGGYTVAKIPFVVDSTTGYLTLTMDGNTISLTNVGYICKHKTVASLQIITSQFYDNVLPAGADINGFRYVQLESEIFIVHVSGLMPMLVLTVVEDSSTVITLSLREKLMSPSANITDPDMEVKLVEGMPISPINASSTALSLSAAGAGTGIIGGTTVMNLGCNDSSFVAEDVGSIFYVDQGSQIEAIFVATAFTDVDTLAGVTITDYSVVTATTRWRRSVFSLKLGFPTTLGFYQSRLLIAGSRAFPSRFWNSGVENFNLFQNEILFQDVGATPSVSGSQIFNAYINSNPFSLQIMSDVPTQVVWMVIMADLFIGTTAGDYRVTFSTSGEFGYSRNNAANVAVSSVNCHNAIATVGDEKILYFSEKGRRVRTIDVQSGDFSYKNTDVSILADHLVDLGSTVTFPDKSLSSFKSAAWVEDHSALWAVTTDNKLVSMTINENSGVVAWTHHDIGIPVESTDELVIDNLDIHREDNKHKLSLVTSTFDGAVYTERRLVTLDIDSNVYLDAFVTIDQGTPETTYTFGPDEDYYVQQIVSVISYDLGYPEYLGEATVNVSREITFPKAVQKFSVGFKYNSRIESLLLEAGGKFGTSRGNTSNADRATISLYESMYGTMGGSEASLNSLELELDEIYSGDKRIELTNTDDGLDYKYIIETDIPLPLNVLGIAIRGVSYDG